MANGNVGETQLPPKIFFYSAWGVHLHPVHPPAYATESRSTILDHPHAE